MSSAIADPGSTVEGEKKGRENEVRRRLARTVYASLSDYERAEIGEHAEGIVQEQVDRTLRAMHDLGWRVHKSSPVCSRCAVALEEEGRPWREYLQSDALQESLTAEKEQRAIEAIAHREKMEANK